MSKREKIFDDIARVAGGSVSVLSGLQRQIREDVRSRIDELALKMDWVPRSEFERLEAMVVKARKEQETLEKRVKALEEPTKKAEKSATKTKTTKKKAVKKKS